MIMIRKERETMMIVETEEVDLVHETGKGVGRESDRESEQEADLVHEIGKKINIIRIT
jgi:hypothetical protein